MENTYIMKFIINNLSYVVAVYLNDCHVSFND